MMRVRWSPEAADDLARIGQHIQEDNPSAARETVVTVYEAVNNLTKFPSRGRAGRLEGTRELVVPSLPYVVVYRIKHEWLEIARIYHGAQNWP